MNRENKRKTFEKGYYKTHACRDAFTCKVCGRLCTPENAGSQHRNHCPNCLSSLHVDVEPGDRASDCGGIMEPVAVWVRRDGEWAVIHRCRRCGANWAEKSNQRCGRGSTMGNMVGKTSTKPSNSLTFSASPAIAICPD